MKKWMMFSLVAVLFLSACAHKNCCGHCKKDQAVAPAEVSTARD